VAFSEHVRVFAALTLLAAIMVGTARADKVVPRPTRGIFGVKVGVMSRANMRGDLKLQTAVGSTAEVYADFPVAARLHVSTAFDFYYIQLVRDNDIMIDANLGLKYEIPLPRANMFLRPGVAFGFGFLPEINTIDASTYATAKLLLEAHFAVNPRRSFVSELALWGAPVGRNNTYDLTLGPAVMLRVGLAFR